MNFKLFLIFLFAGVPEWPKGLDSGSSGLVPSRVRIPPPAKFYILLLLFNSYMKFAPYLKFSELEQMVSNRGYFLMGIDLKNNRNVFKVIVDKERSKILFSVFDVSLLVYSKDGTLYDLRVNEAVKCNYNNENLESLIQLVSKPLEFFEKKDFVYHSNQQGVLQYYGYRQDEYRPDLRYLGPKIENEILSYWPKIFNLTMNSLFDGQNEIFSVNKPPSLEMFSNYIRIMDLTYSLRISDSYISLAQIVDKEHLFSVQVDFYEKIKIDIKKLEKKAKEGCCSKNKINFLRNLISDFKFKDLL